MLSLFLCTAWLSQGVVADMKSSISHLTDRQRAMKELITRLSDDTLYKVDDFLTKVALRMETSLDERLKTFQDAEANKSAKHWQDIQEALSSLNTSVVSQNSLRYHNLIPSVYIMNPHLAFSADYH